MWLLRVGGFGLLGCLVGMAQAQDACVEIHATNAWQPVRFANAPVRVTGISGSWTVDRALGRTGWRGHQGRDAERLAPYAAYKYDPGFAFGELLIRARDGNRNYAVRPPQGDQEGTLVAIERAELRINDSDASLGDNAGSLTICFESLADQPSPEAAGASGAPLSSASSSSQPPRPGATSAQVDRNAWMTCFNDSRQSDADRAALRRWRSDLRSEQRALERRQSNLQDERNHLSYSYNSDQYGIADRARANQERMHQERVDDYNADVDALNDRLDEYDREASAFNARNDAWRSRCLGVVFDSARPLVQQYCVGAAASTTFCESFQ